MVLKILSLFLFCNHAVASLNQAGQAFFKGQYEESIEFLEDAYSDHLPDKALELKAMNLERLKRYKEAIKSYTELIKRRFANDNKRVLDFYEPLLGSNEKLEQEALNYPEIPDKLLFYYFKKSQLYKNLYIDKTLQADKKTLSYYKSRSLLYSVICEKADYDVDAIEELYSEVENFERLQSSHQFHNQWFASFGYISWQDPLEFVDPNGGEFQLQATVKGVCAGGGWKRSSAYHEYGAHACFIQASATVGEDTNLINYQQGHVRISGFLLGPHYLYKPIAGNVAFGMQIPFFFRTGNFGVPPGGYHFDDKNFFSLGYLVTAEWRAGDFAFVSKYGKISQLAASLWMLQLNYTL